MGAWARDHGGMAQVGERRGAERVQLALNCTLTRRTGPAITCETVEVGTGGMSVFSRRPLAADEPLRFELPASADVWITGRARVLRQQGRHLYALRFEHLPDAERARIETLMAH